MSKNFTRRQIVSSLGISGLGVIGLNRLSRPSLAANTDWTGNNVSQEVSNGTISDVTIPQSNLSFEVAYRGLDPEKSLTVRIEVRLQTEESTGSDEFDEIGAGSISLDSAEGTVTETDLTLDEYSFPLGIVSNHSSIEASDFAVGDADTKTTIVEIQASFSQNKSTETVKTAFDVRLSERSSFTLSTASYTDTMFDVASEESSPRDIAFTDDGSKLVVVGSSGSGYEYNLDTAYDITTANYTGNNFDFSNEDSNPMGIEFQSNGSKIFIMGRSTDTVYSYNLSTAYDITTASYTSKSFDLASVDDSLRGLDFNNDGTKLFVNGIDTSRVYSYDLSTAYDIATASYNQNNLDVSSEDTIPQGIKLNSDGSKLYITGFDTSSVYEYNLTTAYDITTASYTGNNLDVYSEDEAPQGLVINSDNSELLLVGLYTDNLYLYSS